MSRSFRTKFPATHTQTTQYRIDYGLGDLGSDAKRRVPCQGGCGRRFLKLKSARWHYCDQCEEVAVLISEELEESIDHAVDMQIARWWGLVEVRESGRGGLVKGRKDSYATVDFPTEKYVKSMKQVETFILTELRNELSKGDI